jgi:hypothetical protein
MPRLLALVLLAACTPTEFAFSPTMKSIKSKPDNCPVEVMTSLPERDYQEVGTLAFYNGPEPKTLDAFKKAVAKQVCDVGGDVAVATADSRGVFTKGTILQYTK